MPQKKIQPKVIRTLGGGWRIEEWFVPLMRQGEEGDREPEAHSFHRTEEAAINCARKKINGKIVVGYAKVGPVHMLVHKSKPRQGIPVFQCRPYTDGKPSGDTFVGMLRPEWYDYNLKNTMPKR